MAKYSKEFEEILVRLKKSPIYWIEHVKFHVFMFFYDLYKIFKDFITGGIKMNNDKYYLFKRRLRDGTYILRIKSEDIKDIKDTIYNIDTTDELLIIKGHEIPIQKGFIIQEEDK